MSTKICKLCGQENYCQKNGHLFSHYVVRIYKTVIAYAKDKCNGMFDKHDNLHDGFEKTLLVPLNQTFYGSQE